MGDVPRIYLPKLSEKGLVRRADFDRYEVLSFDCYGTLIDWEGAFEVALRRMGVEVVRSRPRATPAP